MIALVVTVVILIILATISINVVLGENGLIARAQRGKEVYEQSGKQEGDAINKLLDKYGNLIDGTDVPSEDDEEKYKDTVLQIPPKVTDGMTKVKYNEKKQKWEKVEEGKGWYNYGRKLWANVVLGDATFNSDGTLDESKPYTQLVWIPRYAYKITSGYHSNTTGTIDIKFINESNQDLKGTTYNTTWPGTTDGGAMNNYVVHPAFEYNGRHLAGFWVGKFETSHTGCNGTNVKTGEVAYTGSEVLTIRANVTSWRNLSVSNIYTICINMNKSGNVYKLPTSDSVVDPHMMKNTEWGAVAYLSKSTEYGKGTEEVYINNNQNYITGIAGSTESAGQSTDAANSYKTDAGQKASTSGNLWGVYDMSGGAEELTAAYVNNGDGNLTSYGSTLVSTAPNYHKNVYEASAQGGDDDTRSANYLLSTPDRGFYGDAVYETSKDPTGSYGWFGDLYIFPCKEGPFFERGGSLQRGSQSGLFCFTENWGYANSSQGFRVVVPAL